MEQTKQWSEKKHIDIASVCYWSFCVVFHLPHHAEDDERHKRMAKFTFTVNNINSWVRKKSHKHCTHEFLGYIFQAWGVGVGVGKKNVRLRPLYAINFLVRYGLTVSAVSDHDWWSNLYSFMIIMSGQKITEEVVVIWTIFCFVSSKKCICEAEIVPWNKKYNEKEY